MVVTVLVPDGQLLSRLYSYKVLLTFYATQNSSRRFGIVLMTFSSYAEGGKFSETMILKYNY